MKKRKAGSSFYVASGEVSARIVRLLPLVFCVACTTTVADRTSTVADGTLFERMRRYTDADEIKAKQAMDDLCKRSLDASSRLLDVLTDLNAALDKATTNRSLKSPEVEQAFAVVKNFDHKNLSKLERECIQASANYGRIIEVNDDMARRLLLLDEEQSKRRLDSIRSPLNCTSTAMGKTVYTRCQ